MELKKDVEKYHSFLNKEEIENICNEYISSDVLDYDEFIEKYNKERIYLFLSNIGENILSWYRMKENSKVLEISSDFGQISNILLNKKLKIKKYEIDPLKIKFFNKRFKENKSISIVSVNEIENEQDKYDYVIISNVIDSFKDSKEVFKIVKNVLKDDGILLFIFENGNSINSFSRADNEQGILYMLNDYNNFTLSKLNKNLENINMNEKNMYYSFPNSYLPTSIYEDEFFVENVKSVSYPAIINSSDIVVANEEDMLNQVLKENPSLIKYFANAYIIEASYNKIEQKISMASFNNYRKKDYTLSTVISQNKVYKLPRCEEANTHIENIKEGISYLKNISKDFIDTTDENGIVYSPYISGKQTLDKDIYLKYKETKDLNEVAKIYIESYKLLSSKILKYKDVQKSELLDGIPDEVLSKMNYLEICPWDMVAKNCFLIEKEDGIHYIYFDQEWYEKGLPIEFLIYRSVLNSYDLVKKINVNELFKILGIEEYTKYFDAINQKLFEKILDKKIHSLYTNENLKIDNLLYALKEASIYKENIKDYIENNKKQDNYIKQLEAQLEEFKSKKLKYKVKKLFRK